MSIVLNGRAIATTQKKLKAIPPQLQDIQAAQAGGNSIGLVTTVVQADQTGGNSLGLATSSSSSDRGKSIGLVTSSGSSDRGKFYRTSN